MAAIDFPNSPSLNQVFTANNGQSWQWSGVGWVQIQGNVTTVGSQSLANKQLINPDLSDQVVPDGATINWNAALGSIASVTLGASGRTIANPTNLKKGIYILHVVQDATGGRTEPTFGSNFAVGAGTVSFSTAANARNTYMFVSDGSKLYGHLFAVTSNAPSSGVTTLNVTVAALESADAFSAAGNVIQAAAASSVLFGVNLSGMELSETGIRYSASSYPNRNYTVPRLADLQYLKATGVAKVRLPIRWERLQPILASSPANSTVVAAHNIFWNGVAGVKGGFDQYYESFIQQVLDNCAAAGIKCVLDLHNYCRYLDFKYQADGSVLGLTSRSDKHYFPWTSDSTQVQTRIFSKATSPSLTKTDYADIWNRIATKWKGHPGLEGFGLMNEPNSMPTSTSATAYNDPYVQGNVEDLTIWPGYAQAALSAIRNAGSNDQVFVGGNQWQNVVNWAANNPGFPLTDSASTNAAGTYASGLPNAGTDATGTPANVDANGATTINGLINTAGVNGTVTIPSGTYTISAPIVPKSGQTIKAASGSAVVLKATSAYAGLMLDLTGLNAVTIQNLTFDGNYAARAAQEGVQAASCVQISGGTGGHKFLNNVFMNHPSYGIWLYNSANVTIQSNVFLECYQPLRLDGNNLANSGLVLGNTFQNSSSYKSVQHMDAMNTKGLVVKANTWSGVGTQVPTSHGFEGTWGNSIYIFNSDGFLVENNTVTGNYWSAIVCGQACTNGIVQRNNFSHGYHLGTTGGVQSSWIEQAGCDTITFTRNVLNGGLSAGDTGGDHLTITYNDITVPAGGTGIDANASFQHGTIANNHIKQETDAHTDLGIYLWNKTDSTAALTIQSNYIEGFASAISINNNGGTGTFYGLTITGNTFVSNTSNVTIPNTLTKAPSNNIVSTSTPAPGTGLVTYEGHVYEDASSGGFRFDYDYEVANYTSSGESGAINASTLVNRLTPWVNWLTTNGQKGAITETGMPLQLKNGVLDQRWVTEFKNGMAYLQANSIPAYIWMGGNHWSIHAYSLNHVPQFYQSKTLEPRTGSVMKNVLSIQQATIFDDGPTYSSGAAITIKLQARGNLTSSVTVNIVASSGTLSAASVVLAAGPDSEASFTFTPAANTKATITYSRVSGGQVPPIRTVYSYTDPVSLASTNLADAAATLIGKYRAAVWNMAGAYDDYLNGAQCVAGARVRAVADSGAMSSLDNPMGMLNWYNNQGSNMGSDLTTLGTWGQDTGGYKYMDVSASGAHGLWCKKILPSTDPNSNYSPNPPAVIPFGLHSPHFVVAGVNLAAQGDGVIFQAVQVETDLRSSLKLVGGAPQLELLDSGGQWQPIAGAVLQTSKPTVLSYAVQQGSQVLRAEGVQLGSKAANFATTSFNAMLIGHGYQNYFEQAAAPVKIYGVLVGQGAITVPELNVLEKWMSTLCGSTMALGAAPAPAPAPGAPAPAPAAITDTTIASQFGASGLGFELTADDHSTLLQQDGTAATTPGVGIGTWKDKSGRANNLTQSDTSRNPLWKQTTGGKDYLQFFANANLAAGGGSTSGFLFVASIQSGDGGGNGLDRVLYSDAASANVGHKIRITWDNYVEYSVGNGSSRTVVKSPSPVSNLGDNVMIVWHDPVAGTINAQVDFGSIGTTAFNGSVSAGGAGVRISGDYGVTDTNLWYGRIYAMLSRKNACGTSVERDQARSWVGVKAGVAGFSTGGSSAPAPAPTPAPTPAPAPAQSAQSGTGYAFGARKDAYSAGIKPTNMGSNSAVDAFLQNCYASWKAARIQVCPGISGGLINRFGNDAVVLTVSEGIGYGMLLAAVFNDQATFNGLLTTARARPSYGIQQYGGANGYLGAYLMDWRLYMDGSSGGAGWNALDGDMDMAQALLMADRQWGSTGTWNYRQQAFNTIAAMKAFNFRLSDGTSQGLKDPSVSRSSDWMLNHFRTWGAATGDSFWSTAYERAIYLIGYTQANFAPSTGLLPDFLVATDTANPYPSPGGMGDAGNPHEGDFWWNANRDPWRIGTEYVFSGDPRVKTELSKMADFWLNEVNNAGGDVTAIGTGYSITTGAQLQGGDSGAFMGPIMVAGLSDPKYQTLVNNLWLWNSTHFTSGYYDSEIMLMSMLVASGNWWRP